MPIDRARLLQWLEDASLDLLAVAVILLVGVWLSRRLSMALERVLNNPLARPGALRAVWDTRCSVYL